MHRGPLQPGLQPFDNYLDIFTFFNQTRVKVEDDVHIYVELQIIMNIGHDLDYISIYLHPDSEARGDGEEGGEC